MTNRNSMPDPAELMVEGQRQLARAMTDLLDRLGAWLEKAMSKAPPTGPHQP
jgi:hypothetical protein